MGAYLEAIARGERGPPGEGSFHRGVLKRTSNALVARLYLQYGGQLRKLAKRVDDPRSSCGVDDLVQEGLFGLIESWHIFKEDRSSGTIEETLWPYAFARVKGSMIDELRRTGNFSRVFIKYYHMDQYREFQHEERAGYEPAESKRTRFLTWLECVPPGQARQMISLYILKGISLKAIGKVYGVSEGRVNQVIHKLVRTFKE